MELRQIRYFVAVVDHGSLSRAAREVHVAQSALSKQMTMLEAELETALFHRSATGIIPTEAGNVFYEYACGMLKHLRDAKAAVAQQPGELSGSIVVALPQTVARILALPLMRAAAKRYPNVVLHLNEELTGNLIDQLLHGRVDIALFTPSGLPPEVIFTPVAEEALYYFHAPGDPLAPPPGEVALAEAVSRPLVFPGRAHAHATRAVVEEALADRRMPPLAVAMEVNSVHILMSAVEAGIGPTLMPLNLAAREVREGRLVAHPIAGKGVFRTLGICTCAAMPNSRLRTAMVELLNDVVRDMCESGDWPGIRLIGID